jgi:hypothetical protein
MNNTAPPSKYAIGVTAAALVILAATFMPWGEIPATLSAGNMGVGFFDSYNRMLREMHLTMRVTAWNSTVNLQDLEIPNWIVLLIAAGAALLSWMKAASLWKVPLLVWFLLPGMGVLYTCFVLLNFLGVEQAKAGFGTLLTLLAFVGMLIAMAQQWYDAKRVAATYFPLQSDPQGHFYP